MGWQDDLYNERQRKEGRAVKPSRPLNYLESAEQIAVVAWARQMAIVRSQLGFLFHVMNGGKRRQTEARRCKAEGVLAGVADLILLAPGRGYHALALEMKSADGSLRPDQQIFLQWAAEQGNCAVAAWGRVPAIAVLEWYVGLSDVRPDGDDVEFFYRRGS